MEGRLYIIYQLAEYIGWQSALRHHPSPEGLLLAVMSPPPPDGGFRGGATAGERRASANSSPEFEFWRACDPSSSSAAAVEPHLLSADELFLDGVILPLRLLRHPVPHIPPPPSTAAATVSSAAALGPSSSSSAVAAAASSSKRWRDIFRAPASEKKAGGGLSELNINLWPFSRSRSAGNGGAVGKDGPAGAARRVSSAPCSRSGSRRERELSSSSAGGSKKWVGSAPCSRSGSRREREASAAARPPQPPSTGGGGRKWASSPGRQGLAGGGGGVHVRRVSPVWRMRRSGKKGHGENQGSHFNLRAFFSRKLYI